MMLSQTQLQRALRRAHTIVASGDYDEDCVRRLLAGLEAELKDTPAEPIFVEALQDLELLAR
jgi:hypothetical protein